MINTYRIYTELQQAMDDHAARKLAEILGNVYEDLQNMVTKEDFRELKSAVTELTEAQKRTESRVEELAGAQKELAEAQKEMVVAQTKLAEAQKGAEKSLKQLADEHKETRRQLGGLSMTVGYRLEDEAYRALPGLLHRDHGITISGAIHRRYVKDNRDKDIEINIIGDGKQKGKKITIVGESKSQLSKKDIDRYISNKLNRLEGVFPRLFPVLVTYMTSQPDTEAYAREKGVALYFSYDFID